MMVRFRPVTVQKKEKSYEFFCVCIVLTKSDIAKNSCNIHPLTSWFFGVLNFGGKRTERLMASSGYFIFFTGITGNRAFSDFHHFHGDFFAGQWIGR